MGFPVWLPRRAGGGLPLMLMSSMDSSPDLCGGEQGSCMGDRGPDWREPCSRAGGRLRRAALAGERRDGQHFFSCLALFALVLYLLGHLLQRYWVPLCTSFTCLFSILVLLHAFPQVGQLFVPPGLEVSDGEAPFLPGLLGPTRPTSLSETAAGPTCGEESLVAGPGGERTADPQRGLEMLLLDPSIDAPIS